MANLAAFSDSFFEFENELKLFDEKIEDIYFWALIRDRIHENILINKGLLEPPSQTVSGSLGGKIKTFTKYFFQAFANALKPYPKADTLIINHPRKVNVNGSYQDIYSQWLIDSLKEKGESYLVLDFPLNWSEHPMKKDKHIRNLDNFSIVKKVYYKYFARNKLQNNELLKKISELLIERYGNDGGLFNVCFTQMNIFKADYKYYCKTLKKIQPEKIFYVVINSMFGMIAAAHDLGIEVEEIQHGLMCRYHVNYSFPYNDKIPYFPDRYCLFGKYWGDITPLPLGEDCLDYYVNPIRQNKPGEERPNKNNKIMFLTQLICTTEMLEFLAEILKDPKSSDYEFIIKLHPAEYHVWREIYPMLRELVLRDNITVIDNFDIPLYDLFKQADRVVGVASTSLFEALYFGCDVYLINVSGVEWVRPLMDESFSTFVEKPSEFLEKIAESKKTETDINYIFCDKASV